MITLRGLLILLILAFPAYAQQGNFPAGGGGNSLGSSGANPQTANDVLYVNGGTIYARNNNTGAIDASGTDLRAVWDTLIGLYTGGQFRFKNGIYNCNSLDQENTGVFTNYYCIGIPPGGASNQYRNWYLIGDEMTPGLGIVLTGAVQTGGTIISLTATAVSSVPANSKIMTIWDRPDVTNSVGASTDIENFDFRVPTNQRGCETQVDIQNGLASVFKNLTLDTAVANSSIAFPVQAACTAWGASDPGGLININTTNSGKQVNYFENVNSWGGDVCLDVRSEHTYFIHTYANDCNHGIDYGVRGPVAQPLFHPSVWMDSGCSETARCLTLGTNMALGSALTIYSFDIEDASNSILPAFVPVYHALETNVGYTNGLISYTAVLAGSTFGVEGLLNVFDGGGGGSFSVLQATSQHNIARTPAIDTFTRANQGALGPSWKGGNRTGATGTMQIVSNAAVLNGAGATSSDEIYAGQTFSSNDQFVGVTVNAIDSSASTFVQIFTNYNFATATTTSAYGYYCTHTVAGGSGIFKLVSGTNTNLSIQTSAIGCNAGDVLELRRITSGSNVLLYAYRNGVLDANIPVNPFTDTSSTVTGGVVALSLIQDATQAVGVTNFIGGNFPTVHGTDSIYNNIQYGTAYNVLAPCKVAGSAVAASAVACGSSSAGVFSIPITTPTSAVVTTTALTPASLITVTQRLDTTNGAGAALGVTCNTTVNTTAPSVQSRTATSFTINFAAFTVNPGCYQYTIIN